jgi:uncharacterized protein (TIGR02421 family)
MTAQTRPLSPPTSETLAAAEEPPDPSLGTVTALSGRLAALLRPLRVLDAVRWSPEIEQAFLAQGCRELPPVDRDYYTRRPLPFVPDHVHDALRHLESDILHRLGPTHAASRLMLPRCHQARLVLELLAARGTPRFHHVSATLYGRSGNPLPNGAPSLAAFAGRLAAVSGAALEDTDLSREEQSLSATEAARRLAERLGHYFFDDAPVKILVSDDLNASACVGGDCLKLRRDAWFSERDVRLLEVHEGWVHLGTSRNARRQSCAFLSRPLPAATRTQEGLAVWTEVLAFASHPARLRLLAGRVEAVAIAEQGGDFLDVFRHFGELGFRPVEAYRQAARVFRGSLPDAGPFTKDLAYAFGFAEVGHFLSQAVVSRSSHLVPLLFAGKVSVDDLPALDELRQTGLVRAPSRLPPPFADSRSLAAMVCLLGCPESSYGGRFVAGREMT